MLLTTARFMIDTPEDIFVAAIEEVVNPSKIPDTGLGI